jgi:hypothetical protein
MSLITAENAFLLVLWYLASIAIVLISVLILHFFMPKSALDRYFTPPHFRPFEYELFKGMPYSPIRTVMFMTVFAFPRLGKKRNMTKAYKLCPRWYRGASRILIVTIVIQWAIAVFSGLGYYIHQLIE